MTNQCPTLQENMMARSIFRKWRSGTNSLMDSTAIVRIGRVKSMTATHIPPPCGRTMTSTMASGGS